MSSEKQRTATPVPAGWSVSWSGVDGKANSFTWDAVWKVKQHVGQLLVEDVDQIVVRTAPLD